MLSLEPWRLEFHVLRLLKMGRKQEINQLTSSQCDFTQIYIRIQHREYSTTTQGVSAMRSVEGRLLFLWGVVWVGVRLSTVSNPPNEAFNKMTRGLSVMMYTRAAASDYDDWENTFKNPGWGSAHLIPLLQKVSRAVMDLSPVLTACCLGGDLL